MDGAQMASQTLIPHAARRHALGRAALRGSLIGAAVGVAALVGVTSTWMLVNMYLESQKAQIGIPDVVTPPYVAALLLIPYALPPALVGCLLGVAIALIPRIRPRG
jgi:hypothetical protein